MGDERDVSDMEIAEAGPSITFVSEVTRARVMGWSLVVFVTLCIFPGSVLF